MPNLEDGESIQVQGSASRPYVLKHLAGVYSCTCPAWRNQSLPIDRRSCKHLRSLRGQVAEEERVGSGLAVFPIRPAQEAKAPPLLLAEAWDEDIDPTGWNLSEKLDGLRVYWDGKDLLSRNGNRYLAPGWFTAGLPLEPLDGELWIGRKQFQRTASIVRRQDGGALWQEVRFLIFDAPAHEGPFESRLDLVRLIVEMNRPPHAAAHAHVVCRGKEHLRAELDRVEGLGGEGLMLRQPGSLYQAGRSSTLLKVKRFRDAEARVVGHEPGCGRHRGRLGALLVELADGTRFAVGTGLSDTERTRPPALGSVIAFRYQELSEAGVPRFPSYVGLRPDIPCSAISTSKGEKVMPVTATTRRFECVEGASNKFWQVTVSGAMVTVHFGRIGTAGQQETKSFADPAAAAKHAEKKVKEKLSRGYRPVS